MFWKIVRNQGNVFIYGGTTFFSPAGKMTAHLQQVPLVYTHAMAIGGKFANVSFKIIS